MGCDSQRKLVLGLNLGLDDFVFCMQEGGFI